jgi:hypothetical protein
LRDRVHRQIAGIPASYEHVIVQPFDSKEVFQNAVADMMQGSG